MFTFLDQISLIRYLIVWRVNSSLVFLPRYLSIDISYVLGSIIAERLPSSEKTAWKKALRLDKTSAPPKSGTSRINTDHLLETNWPIDAVLFTYPSKLAFGRDELIFWELKLFGEHADHGLFLELILPAMETASVTADIRLHHRHQLWGHFDVLHVFAARGNRWEPVVLDGRLDLKSRVMPFQWQEQLALVARPTLKRLTWMSPFDLNDLMFHINKFQISFENHPLFHNNAPTLSMLLAALIFRLHELCIGRKKPQEQIGNFLNEQEQHAFRQALHSSYHTAVIDSQIKSAPRNMPGKWIGVQRFQMIPPAIIPYLELASIFHIGNQTHFGCGSFILS